MSSYGYTICLPVCNGITVIMKSNKPDRNGIIKSTNYLYLSLYVVHFVEVSDLFIYLFLCSFTFLFCLTMSSVCLSANLSIPLFVTLNSSYYYQFRYNNMRQIKIVSNRGGKQLIHNTEIGRNDIYISFI